MLRQVFYVIVCAYIIPVCLGLFILAPDWLTGRQQRSGGDSYPGLDWLTGRQQSSGGDSYPGLSLLNSEVGPAIVKTVDRLPSTAVATDVRSHMADTLTNKT